MGKKSKKQDRMTRVVTLCVLAVFLVILVLFTGRILSRCFSYELNHAYTADAPLYWTVGRGMLNGIKPYSGLYENKPVGVFLISALSLGLTDGTILCNVCSLLCMLVIGLLPAAYTLEFCLKKKLPVEKILLYTGFAWLLGMFLMLYCEMRSGGFQVENMGAAFIGLYFWAIMHIQWEKGDSRSSPSYRKKCVRPLIWTLLAAFFAMCGVMMKEPFALMAVAGSLLLLDSPRDFLSRTVVPMCTGGVMALVLLLCCGVLPEYFRIYLANMFGNHLSVYGSPFSRMLQFDKITANISAFSKPLLWIILLSVLLILHAGVFCAREISIRRRLWRGLAMGIALFSASFCVGLGGQYYNHHYIFAAPLYILVILLACRILVDTTAEKRFRPQAVAVAGLLLLIFLKPQTDIAFAGDYSDKYASIVSQANYVDALLDYYGEDTYQFLGFNGENKFYGLTKHSPKGPAFAQDQYNFTEEDSWFSQQLLNQLDEVNIVILDRLNMPAINERVQKILDTQFTTEPENPYTGMEKPASFRYRIYYRIN